jgi:serine/threonine protein kinase
MQQGNLIGGKYRLGPVIGSGGVATVYRATHIWTEREVAVKVLDPGLPHFERLREAFLREARATVQLHHPNVVDVLDMGEDDWATVYMVMELLEGPTLRDVLIERERLSETETLSILLPLIDALEKAHELGVVHRDFKPENVMLVQDAGGVVIPKLLDFGVAEILQDARSQSIRNRNDIIMGTPQYMSPEQARDQRALIGPHTDVWGVGVVWYECLTGHAPFDGDTSVEILESVCSSSIDFEVLPEDYVPIFRDLLHRSTESRIGSLSALKKRIEEMGVELPSIPPPDPSVSSRIPVAPDDTGVQRTLAGVGPQELLAPSPLAMRVDSELLHVPFRSQRRLAFAGIGFAVAVILAAWWTVRDAGEANQPVSGSAHETIEPVPATVGSDAPADQPPVVLPEEEFDTVEPVEALPTAASTPTPAPIPEAAPPPAEANEAASTARRAGPRKPAERKARRTSTAKPRPTPAPPKDSRSPHTPELVTEW